MQEEPDKHNIWYAAELQQTSMLAEVSCALGIQAESNIYK